MRSSIQGKRHGQSRVITVLLVLILIALVTLIALVLANRPGRMSSEARSGDGSRGTSARAGEPGPPSRNAEPAPPPPPPKPVGDPERIRDVLQVGKTYETVLKTGIDVKVVDKDWGIQQTINMTYVAESRVRRHVERNDGKTVVVLLHFVESRAVKVLSDADVRFDLGAPGVLVLGFLDQWLTGGLLTSVIVPAVPVAQHILTKLSQEALERAVSKAKASADSLEGKRVRVTYEDGKGVVHLEPVGCTLTDDERDYLEGLAVLSDCYLLPDIKSKPGQYWDVEAGQLMPMLPPNWRGRPSGTVTIERGQDIKKDGKTYAVLQISSGTFQVDATDRSRRRLGVATPRGRLEYNITDGYIESAHLKIEGRLEEVSTDHLLFEARFESAPRIEVQYTCRLLKE